MAEAAAGPCWQQEPAGCAGQDLGCTPQQALECAIQVAKADKLDSSYLAQGTSLSYVSGTMRLFVLCAGTSS